MGYRNYDIEGNPNMLYKPFINVYFGAAYIKWLFNHNDKYVVRSPNEVFNSLQISFMFQLVALNFILQKYLLLFHLNVLQTTKTGVCYIQGKK